MSTLLLDRHALKTALVCSLGERDSIVERVTRHLDHRRYSYQEQILAIALADAMWVRRWEVSREMFRTRLREQLAAHVADEMTLDAFPEVPAAFAQATLAAATNAAERGNEAALERELARVDALVARGEL